MPWTDRLTRARWRDLEFLTDAHDAKYGRRLVVHEYPGADVPLVEDLGGKAEGWELTAYFIGPDYDLKRNELLKLLAEPGPDWLLHPWLGNIWVRAQDWTTSETTEKGGFATIKISFVPGGETKQPEYALNDAAQAASVDMADAAIADFGLKPMSADALSQYIAAVHQRLNSLRRIISLATLPFAWSNRALTALNGIKSDLASIAGVPALYAAAWKGLANALGLSKGDGRDITAELSPGSRAAVVGRIANAGGASRSSVTITGAATSDPALLANLRAEYALEQRMIVAAALSVAVAEYPVEPDRDQAAAAVERGINCILYTAPDVVFQPAATARAAVLRALFAQDFRATTRRDIARPLPSALIAHGLGVDETTFLQRNAVRPPLFITGAVYG